MMTKQVPKILSRRGPGHRAKMQHLGHHEEHDESAIGVQRSQSVRRSPGLQLVGGHREQATNTCVGRRWKAKFSSVNSRQFPATISRTNVLTPCPGWGNYHSGHQQQTMEITMSK